MPDKGEHSPPSSPPVDLESMTLLDLGQKVFEPIHFMAVLGQGSSLSKTPSYSLRADVVTRHTTKQPNVSAGFTRYSGPIHQLFRNTSQRFGEAMDMSRLPQDTQTLASFWSDNPERYSSPDRPKHYVTELAGKLEADELKQVPLLLKLNGKKNPTTPVEVANVEVGTHRMPLARVLFALGKAGPLYTDRPHSEEHFIENTIDRAITIVENMQAVQDNVCEQLRERYQIQNPMQVLRDSGMDIDRGKLRTAIRNMANLVAVYDAADKLHAMQGMTQQYGQMVKAITPMLGGELKPECQDAFQARRLIEALHEYMLNKDNEVERNRANLRTLGVNPESLAAQMKEVAEGKPEDAKALLALPQVQALVKAASQDILFGVGTPQLGHALSIIGATSTGGSPPR